MHKANVQTLLYFVVVVFQFRFADRLDKFLMVLGLCGGIGHGIGGQINLLILAQTIDLFANATTVTE